MVFRKIISGSAFIFFTMLSFSPQKLFPQGLFSKVNSFNLLLKYRSSSGKPVFGISAKVESNGIADQVYTSVADSNQGILFLFDKTYTIRISKEGYHPLKIIVDTDFKEKKGRIKINHDKNGWIKLDYEMELAIPLCPLTASLPTDSAQKADARIFFDPSAKKFVLDSNYLMSRSGYTVDELCKKLLRESVSDSATNKPDKFVDYNAKLVYGEKKSSLVDQGLRLKDSNGDVVQSTKTDVYGDFTFKKINAQKNFNIVLDENNKLSPDETIYLMDHKGEVRKELSRDANNDFVFDLLSEELLQITENSAEEVNVLLTKFKSNTERELTITEHILYASGEWRVSSYNSSLLMSLIQILQQNPNFKVEIYSYTDAVGGAQANMELSENRAKAIVELFVSKGIKAERMKWKGFGATKMVNRCAEGVECSEEERQANRRTEFRLIKDER
jgi:outer membrane protein OmpA-like peptidoglycan-associated protein